MKKTIISILLSLSLCIGLLQYQCVSAKGIESIIPNTNYSKSNSKNKLKTYKYGTVTLQGKIYKKSWKHDNGSVIYYYMLKLYKPANFKVHTSFGDGVKTYKNVKQIQIWGGEDIYKEDGQKVKITGKLEGDMGTYYYKSNVVLYI